MESRSWVETLRVSVRVLNLVCHLSNITSYKKTLRVRYRSDPNLAKSTSVVVEVVFVRN